jgi:hypothetical protein
LRQAVEGRVFFLILDQGFQTIESEFLFVMVEDLEETVGEEHDQVACGNL